MLKRVALTIAATAALAVPTVALASPASAADGVLPDEACHAVYPYHTQPVLCGRGKGGPGSG